MTGKMGADGDESEGEDMTGKIGGEGHEGKMTGHDGEGLDGKRTVMDGCGALPLVSKRAH